MPSSDEGNVNLNPTRYFVYVGSCLPLCQFFVMFFFFFLRVARSLDVKVKIRLYLS
jgi:hypothetical protein